MNTAFNTRDLWWASAFVKNRTSSVEHRMDMSKESWPRGRSRGLGKVLGDRWRLYLQGGSLFSGPNAFTEHLC